MPAGVYSTSAHTLRSDPVPRNWHPSQGYVLDATGRVVWWGRVEDPFEAAIERAADATLAVLSDGMAAAMGRFNA